MALETGTAAYPKSQMSQAGSRALSAWFLLVTVISFATLALSLTAYQVRIRLANTIIAGQSFSQWRIARIQDEDVRSPHHESIRKLQNDLRDNLVIRQTIDDEAIAAKTDIGKRLDEFVANLREAAPEKQIPPIRLPRNTGNQSLVEFKKKIDDLSPPSGPARDSYKEVIASIHKLEMANEKAIKFTTTNLSPLQKQLEFTKNSVVDRVLGEESKASHSDREKVLDLLDEIGTLRSKLYIGLRLFDPFLIAPPTKS